MLFLNNQMFGPGNMLWTPPNQYSNPVLRSPLTIPADSEASIIFNADHSTTPLNYLEAEISTDTGIFTLNEVVDGVETPLISEAITYADAKELIVVVDKATDGLSSAVSVFYDGSQVGTSQEITDTTILNGKRHYLSGDTDSILYKRRFALGSELVVNGGMELDSNWEDYGVVVTNTRSSAQAHSGSYSRKIVPGAQWSGIHGDGVSLTAGIVYEVEFWIYGDGVSAFNVRIWKTGISFYLPGSPGDAGIVYPVGWTKVAYKIGVVSSGTYYLQIYSGTGVSSGTYYADDCSTKEVLLP